MTTYELKEMQLIELALKQLARQTGLQTELLNQELKLPGTNLIGNAKVQIAQNDYIVEAKLTITKAQLWIVKNHLERICKPTNLRGLVITRYITPQMADILKENNIYFIDTAGNAYIKDTNIFIFIQGNKPVDQFKTKLQTRAFQPTGLKLIFALLCNSGLEKKPYREIGWTAGVALGTVNWVMKDLKKLGFLIEAKKGGRQLKNKKELIDRWVTTYPEKFRPKQLIGRYTTTNKIDIEMKILEETLPGTLLGGEGAAKVMTNYLKPLEEIIYTEDLLPIIIQAFRLTPDPNGNIELLKIFWTFKKNQNKKGLVPPLLVYADLLGTGDPRNIEVAKIIYKDEIIELIE